MSMTFGLLDRIQRGVIQVECRFCKAQVVVVLVFEAGDNPELVGLDHPVPVHSLLEFHCSSRQFGLEVVPAFVKTYLKYSPCGPRTCVPEGTPVTLTKGSPVYASNI